MADDVFVHDVHIAIAGYEVWPLTWPVIAGLAAAIIVVAVTTIALMLRRRDDEEA